MSDGRELPIEDIKSGDSVISFDSASGIFVESKVSALVIQEASTKLPWMEITLEDGRTVVCTEDHPIMTERGWVEARFLSASDEVLTT